MSRRRTGAVAIGVGADAISAFGNLALMFRSDQNS